MGKPANSEVVEALGDKDINCGSDNRSKWIKLNKNCQVSSFIQI